MKLVPVVASIAILVLVAVVQERSRTLAAILAVMPLTMPLAAWIVFSSTAGDYRETERFVRAMLPAYAPTVVFILACWYGLRHEWPFSLVMVFAFGAWGVLAALPYVIRRVL